MTGIRITTLLMALGAATFVGAAEIQLSATAQVEGGLVLLGDVAEVFTNDTAEAAELENIELFPVPALGNKRYVRLREIQDVLELRGVSLARHTFSGASQVTITAAEPAMPAVVRVSGSHSAAQVRQAVRMVQEAIVHYLQSTASAAENWQVEPTLDEAAIGALVTAGRIESISGGQAPWTGNQQFVAQLPGAESTVALALPCKVSVTPAVVVATRAVPRGAVIQATDVQLDRSQTPSRGDVLMSLDEVIGKEAAQTLVAGRPIDRDAIRQPLLVKRGDVVTVHVRSPGVQVRTAARARDMGSLGELVTVESLENRETYFARVTGIQEVEVYARGQSAP